MTEKPTMGEQAYALLSDRITSGALRPGLKLKPEELRADLGLGTSPIREALLRLASEGLVAMHGQRGFSVPETTAADLRDIAEVRARLSLWALEMSIEKGDADWEVAIVSAFHRLESMMKRVIEAPDLHFKTWEHLNADFHRALECGCGSPLMLRFLQIAFAKSERYRRHFVRYPDLLPKAQEEHREIMEAALARDFPRASRALAQHIESGARIVLSAMDRRENPKADPPG